MARKCRKETCCGGQKSVLQEVTEMDSYSLARYLLDNLFHLWYFRSHDFELSQTFAVPWIALVGYSVVL